MFEYLDRHPIVGTLQFLIGALLVVVLVAMICVESKRR